jgi:hypothetical protein
MLYILSISIAAFKARALYYFVIYGLFSCTIFFHIISNDKIFGKKLLNIKYVFWFSLQLLPETFLFIRIIQQDIIIKYRDLYVKYPLFLSDFNDTWIFSADFREILKYQIS